MPSGAADVVELVRRGAVEDALHLIRTAFPELLEKQPKVLFKLLCQQFIELIRQRKKEEALLFAQKEWSAHAKEQPLLEELHVRALQYIVMAFRVDDDGSSDVHQDVFALIAYEDPENSPISHYLADGFKDRIARSVNSAILGTAHRSAHGGLNLLLPSHSPDVMGRTSSEFHGLNGEAALEVVLRQLVVVRQLADQGKQGIVTPKVPDTPKPDLSIAAL